MSEKMPPEIQKQMKKAGMKISFMMALVMSLCLSIAGNLSGRRPEGTPVISIIISIIISFVISFIIRLLLGLVIPIGRINAFLSRKLDLKPGNIETRLFESLISDIIYTPFITLTMTALAYSSAMRASGGKAQITYLTMFLGSLTTCMIVGFILIFIFQPLFYKMYVPKQGDNDGE